MGGPRFNRAMRDRLVFPLAEEKDGCEHTPTLVTVDDRGNIRILRNFVGSTIPFFYMPQHPNLDVGKSAKSLDVNYQELTSKFTF